MSVVRCIPDLNPSRPVGCSDITSQTYEVLARLVKQVELQNSGKSSVMNSSVNECEMTGGKNNVASTSRSGMDSSCERSKQRSGNKKKRGVRHRRRKWKPYYKLTWSERQKLDERIARRAYRFRERMSASGLTLAPYNTTQFLMEDHNLQEPDYSNFHETNKSKDDYHSSEDYYSSPDEEEEFIQQQFSETYDNYHSAYINEMSRFDLMAELIRLEDEIEKTEQSLCESWKKNKPDLDVEAELEKIHVFQDEIAKLVQENYLLEEKNKMLESRLSKKTAG